MKTVHFTLVFLLLAIIIIILVGHYHPIHKFDINNINYKHIKFEPSLKQKFKNSVIIAGTCRNVAEHLPRVLNTIENLRKNVDESIVIISEEGSSDNTRDILLQYARQYPRVKLLLKDKNTYPSRTIRIADGRNEILNYIRNSSKCKNFDYLLFLDMDAVNNNNTIANTVHHAIDTMNRNGDLLSIFPVSIPPFQYYDYWALKMEPNFLENFIHDCSYKSTRMKKAMMETIVVDAAEKKKLIVVESAFNGAGLYRVNQVIKSNALYDGVTCEHLFFNIYLNHYYPDKFMAIHPLWKCDEWKS